MSKTFFGFAIADSMFPLDCVASRCIIDVGEVQQLLLDHGVDFCLNPSHQATIDAAISRYGLSLVIPKTAPKVELKVGDKIIAMSVRGLPRLEGRSEYTPEEIQKAEFAFGLWTVIE